MTMQACTSTWDQDVLYYTVWKQFRLNLEISLTVKIVQDGDDDDDGGDGEDGDDDDEDEDGGLYFYLVNGTKMCFIKLSGNS